MLCRWTGTGMCGCSDSVFTPFTFRVFFMFSLLFLMTSTVTSLDWTET